MIDSKNQPRLVKTGWGFYQYDPLPSDEELNHYYEKRYYQEGLGSCEVVYSEEEISYFRLKARLIYLKCLSLVDIRKRQRLIDIGCGEGWVMDEFSRQGLTVLGLDFSKHGIEKFHPHLLPFFEQGDIYKLLKEKVRIESRFDVLLLANVIEHVKDPVKLLQEVKRMMHPNSILIIVAPNDFSPLHEILLAQKKITRKFWLCYPDHLSYFNKDSMTNLVSDLGFKIHSIVADNPVDLNLLNDNSNYVEDPSKGKNIHFFRVRSDNFLGSRDPEKLLRIYEILGSMGVGRDLNYYCSIAR